MQIAQGVDDLVNDQAHSPRVERAELLQNVLEVPVDVIGHDFKRSRLDKPKLLLLNMLRKEV